MGVDAVLIDKPFTLPPIQQIMQTKAESASDQKEVRVGLYKNYAASMDEGWTRWVFDQYKNEPLGFKLSYTSLTDFDIRAGTLELKLVASGTDVPYKTREQAEAAARSAARGGDTYTSRWETAFYRERPDSNGGNQDGWIVVGATPVVTGHDVRNASAQLSEWARSEYLIDFSLTTEGATRLSDATSKHVGDHLAIIVSGEVKSAPRINSMISDRAQISGNFTKQSAESLAAALGDLRSRFDCIVIPAQSSQQIANGLSKDRYPATVSGGMGAAGIDALKRFIEDGGTLITLNAASEFAIDKLGVPVKNSLEGVAAREFYCPGSILKIKLDTTSSLVRNAPLLEGSRDESIAWVEGSLAFETSGPDARVVARFVAANELLLSGWLLGAEKLANKAAIVEVKKGKGRVVMFAFRPQYRGQSVATFPFLFNAIRTSVSQQ